jgi:hypothetical protein
VFSIVQDSSLARYGPSSVALSEIGPGPYRPGPSIDQRGNEEDEEDHMKSLTRMALGAAAGTMVLSSLGIAGATSASASAVFSTSTDGCSVSYEAWASGGQTIVNVLDNGCHLRVDALAICSADDGGWWNTSGGYGYGDETTGTGYINTGPCNSWTWDNPAHGGIEVLRGDGTWQTSLAF